MTYEEFIATALKGRSVNSLAKQWGVPQTTLNGYVLGRSMPDFSTAMIMAKEAGIEEAEAFKLLAAEDAKRKNRVEKIKMVVGKLQPSFDSLLRIANACWTRVQRVAQ